MNSIKRYSFVVILLLFIISLNGCFSSNALKYYPDFINRKDSITSIIIMSDITIFDSGLADEKIVDVPLSIKISKTILDTLKKELTKKNYVNNRVITPSVGYLIPDSKATYKIYNSVEDYDCNTDSLDYSFPPFLVAPELRDTLLKNTILKNSMYYKTETNADINKRNSFPKNCLFVFKIVSNNVSVSKSFIEAFFTALITLGTVSIYSVSDYTANYWLIDIDTGETILADARYEQGENVDEEKAIDILMDFVNTIPQKYYKDITR